MSTKQVCAMAIENDTDYYGFEQLVAARIAGVTGPLFTTDAEGLGEAYLAAIPAEHRQHYTCKACLDFLDKYGGLATIEADGRLMPAIWNSTTGVSAFFVDAVLALSRKVVRAKVTGVFLSSEEVWGKPRTGDWTHLSGRNPHVFRNVLKTAFQASAEKKEDYITLNRGLAEYNREAVFQAVRVLEADALDRSEKTLGIAQWLLALHCSLDGVKGPARDNMVWLAVAKAPPGFCHVRSTMIATLLDDIVAGLDFDAISRRWAQKMHPLQYQRPTMVKAGTIEQANKVMEQLGASGALARRFARRSDLCWIWVPTPAEPEEKSRGPGVFDHLLAKAGVATVQAVELPATTMTWVKFRDTVLPSALSMQVQLSNGMMPFCGMVTAADAAAPPLLQWDGEPRNPVSWYFYHGGSTAVRWGLTAGSWAEVGCVCMAPPHWHNPEKFQHINQMVHFVLPDARDTQYVKGGCFFPEQLRSEFHGVRSVMEAYAQEAVIAGRDEGDANGIAFQKGNTHGLTVRVRTAQGAASYRLDRWD